MPLPFRFKHARFARAQLDVPMAGVTEHSRRSLTVATEHSHNHGRKRPLLVYAFDYKPEHLGSFYYLYEGLGPDIASKLIFAVWGCD